MNEVQPAAGSPTGARRSAWMLGVLLLLCAVIALAGYLRFSMIAGTFVEDPLRADAGEYYAYAMNLKLHGIYSRDPGAPGLRTPRADALRSPGYPLFLLPFVEFPPTERMVRGINFVQATLSTLTVLLTYLLARLFLPAGWSLAVATLTALSPHLVSMNVYVLTESLFTLGMVVVTLVLALAARARSSWLAAISGLLLAVVLLIRPTLIVFPAFLATFWLACVGGRRGIRLVMLVLAGFLVGYAPWIVYKAQLPDRDAPGLAVLSVHKGMYPDLMYQGDPRSHGIPNRFDPSWSQRQDMQSVLQEIAARVQSDPMRYLEWYALGKPSILFSWDIVVGAGDVFVYPVVKSPLEQHAMLDAAHAMMKWLHSPLMVLMAIGTVMVWIPGMTASLSPEQRLVARLVSLVVVYFTAVHVAGTPLPRYAIPLRPLSYGLAMLPLAAALAYLKAVLQRRI